MNANALSAAILAASTSVHFPDVLPWLDLYYGHGGATAEVLKAEELGTALDDLLMHAVLQFGNDEGIWMRECRGHRLLLFRSVWRHQLFPDIHPLG
jgi:hypothetical protein